MWLAMALSCSASMGVSANQGKPEIIHASKGALRAERAVLQFL